MVARNNSNGSRLMLYTERRVAERVESSIAIAFQNDGELIFCNIRNISSSGAYIESDNEFLVGDKISFYITDNQFGVPLEATVVRRQLGPGASYYRPGVGVAFSAEYVNFPSTREDMKMYLLNYPLHQIWERHG